MIVLGVTGFLRSGKNTVTSLLAKHYGFQQYAFADALRKMAAAINPSIDLDGAADVLLNELHAATGRPEEHRYKGVWRYADLVQAVGYDRAKDVPDFRLFLQRLGTEGVRGTFGPNAWVDALAHRVRTEQPERVAISDTRYESEAAWIHAQGGKLWRINRPGVGGTDPHPSETTIPLLPANRDITASSLEELERAVLQAFAEDFPSIATTSHTPDHANHTTAAQR